MQYCPSLKEQLRSCGCSPSFDDFVIWAHGINEFLLEIKESLLIECDKPECNNNISSAFLSFAEIKKDL